MWFFFISYINRHSNFFKDNYNALQARQIMINLNNLTKFLAINIFTVISKEILIVVAYAYFFFGKSDQVRT